MKYIKLFESFNDFSNIKNDIRDIFVELVDDKFNVRFRPNIGWRVREDNPDRVYDENFLKAVNTGNFSVILERQKDDTYDFQISEVYEYIMMLVDFVESIGINSKVCFKASTRNKRGSNYIKKMTLTQLEKFAEEGKPINFIEIVFENTINESYDSDCQFSIDEKFKKDIKDMFVELEDDDWLVDIDYLDKCKGIQDIMVMINNDKNDKLFNSNMVKDYFLMLLDYTKDYYDVLTHKFAVYKRIPSRTLIGFYSINTFTTDTKYYDEFPDDLDGLESMGIHIIMRSER